MISLDEFNGIYNQHVDAVFRVTLRSVGRREIAEEFTSNVFLTLFQSAETASHDQVSAWLFTVARRHAADYWLHWYLEQRWTDGPAEPEIPDHFHPHSGIPFEDLLARCPGLKPVHRACLILRFVHGISREEITTQTSLSETQVKGHLRYGLKLLRETLTSPWPNLPAPELSADA